MKNGIRSRSRAELLLAGVITARATSYLFSKLIMQSMSMFNMLGIRFLLAFTLLLILFFKRIRKINRKTFAAGAVMGCLYFLVMTAELNGLKRTSSGNVSFLENTAIVIVPLLQALLLRRFPRWKAVICALLCLIGVGFLTIGSGMAFGAGEMFCMLAAFLYACAILTTDRLTHGNIDALASGIVQVGIIGALSLTASLLFEAPRLPSGMLEWTGIVMLAVVCSGFGFTLQPVAQSGTTAERAGMFCALNPMVATILGIVFLHEAFTVQSAVGGGLILAGILISELPEPKPKEKLLRV
ncbi:MAG: DMT family transporter [Oscillospiraceae bacterium]|nr:DMT family transporter [Oscillospiraceae bacterium]